MNSFSYVAFDRRGAEMRGALTVDSLPEALRTIREMGYFPTKVTPAPSSTGPASRRPDGSQGRASTKVRRPILRSLRSLRSRRERVSSRTLVVFTRQTATFLEAGMPLLRGLRLLRQQESRSPLRHVIDEVADSIEGGASVSEAMAQHPRIFNALYLQMVRAGEISGALDLVLRRLADLLEKAQRLRNKIVAALFYPAAVILVALAVLGILVVFVVPRFEQIFQGLLNGRPMPTFTQFVINLSVLAKNNLPLLAVLGIGSFAGLSAFARTRPGRAVLDRIKLELPLFGELCRKAAVVRFTRTLATLTSNGVPILQALQIVRDTAGNSVLAQAVQRVHDGVTEGETITAPLKASGVFPALVVGMIDIGEQTGALPEMLAKIADTYEDEVDNTVSALMSLLEPAMIVFLAVIVGSIVIALFLPLIDIVLNGDFGNGGTSE